MGLAASKASLFLVNLLLLWLPCNELVSDPGGVEMFLLTSCFFSSLKPEMSSGLMGHEARNTDLTYITISKSYVGLKDLNEFCDCVLP